MSKSGPTVVDLFSGCGGMSWGLRKSGFTVVAGVDNNPRALEAFALNMPEAKALDLDLTKVTDELLPTLGLARGELDVLVGGPPCQGFSKNVPRSGRYLEDPRNLLVYSFLHAVEILLPKVVVMENVAEMANAFAGTFREEVHALLGRIGYEYEFGIHNAAEFGVPQRRRRVLFVASRTGRPVELPQQSHSLSKASTKAAVSVWDAIGDLAPVRGARANPNGYSAGPKNDFQELMRRDCRELTDHEERVLRPTQQARYDSLEPGQGIKDLPDHLRPKSGYSGAYGRLTKTMVAPTITRWVFHPGSGRFGHPVESRILTIREAARLQSFSDDFRFVGTNQDKSWQIGNAVPPVLAASLAPAIKLALGAPGVQVPRRRARQLSLLEAAGGAG